MLMLTLTLMLHLERVESFLCCVTSELRGPIYSLEVTWESGDTPHDPKEYSLLVGPSISVMHLDSHQIKLTSKSLTHA